MPQKKSKARSEVALKREAKKRALIKSGNVPHNPDTPFGLKARGKKYRQKYDGKLTKYYRQFLVYEDAKWLVRRHNIRSTGEYARWVRTAGHKQGFLDALPNRPDTIYKDIGWVSWNEFLGTNNVFILYKPGDRRIKKNWPTYHEAMRIVHKQGFTYYPTYQKWAKENGLPTRPDYNYKEHWIDWPTYLGKTVTSKIDLAKENFFYVALVYKQGYQQNVFHFVIAKEGLHEYQKFDDEDVMIGAVWRLEREEREKLQEFISRHTGSYHEEQWIRIIDNIHVFADDVDSEFERVEKNRIHQHL